MSWKSLPDFSLDWAFTVEIYKSCKTRLHYGNIGRPPARCIMANLISLLFSCRSQWTFKKISFVGKKKKKRYQEMKLFSCISTNWLFFFFSSPEDTVRQYWTINRQTDFKINVAVLLILGIRIQFRECTWRAHRHISVIWLSWIGSIPLPLQSQACTLTAK